MKTPTPTPPLIPMLQPEIGPDGLPREASVIAYTEKVIEEEQLQLRKYIEENYSKIRDVERELSNLTMEMKLTAGPKKAALELMRKKIEMSTERIRIAKLKEEQARKVWEAALEAVKEEEAIKQKLCEDLNNLVQESSNSQFSKLEELKRKLEALNPNRASSAASNEVRVGIEEKKAIMEEGCVGESGVSNGRSTENESEGKLKKKVQFQGKGRGMGGLVKGRVGWTGAGFDVDGRT